MTWYNITIRHFGGLIVPETIKSITAVAWWQAGRHGASAAVEPSHPELNRNQSTLEMAWSLWHFKPTACDMPLPPRPHLLILTEQFHQLGTKYSTIWTCKGHSHWNHHRSSGLRESPSSFNLSVTICAICHDKSGSGPPCSILWKPREMSLCIHTPLCRMYTGYSLTSGFLWSLWSREHVTLKSRGHFEGCTKVLWDKADLGEQGTKYWSS